MVLEKLRKDLFSPDKTPNVDRSAAQARFQELRSQLLSPEDSPSTDRSATQSGFQKLPGSQDNTQDTDRSAAQSRFQQLRQELLGEPEQDTPSAESNYPAVNWQQKQAEAHAAQQEYQQEYRKAFLQASMLGIPVQSPALQTTADGRTLDELQKRADDLQQEATAMRERGIFTRDMQTIASMSEEEKNALWALKDVGGLGESFRPPENPFTSLVEKVTGRDIITQQEVNAERTKAMQTLYQAGYTDEQIKNLAETYAIYRNQIAAAERQQKTREAVNSGAGAAVGHNLLAVPANIYGAVRGTLGAADEAMRRRSRGSQYDTLDPNLEAYRFSDYASDVRSQTRENIEDGNGIPGKIGGFFYGATTSAVDNLARIAVAGPAGSLALAGMSSFQDSVRDVSRRGGTAAQAYGMGVVSAAFEILTEKISLDRLIDTPSPTTIAQALKNAAIQGGIEVSEEELNFAAGAIADAMIMGEKSNLRQQYHELIVDGASPQDAAKQVTQGLLMDAVNIAAESFLSGSMMSAGTQTQSYLQNRHTTTPGQPSTDTQTPATDNNVPTTPVGDGARTQNVGAATSRPQTNTPTANPESAAADTVNRALEAFKSSGTVPNSTASRILSTPGAVEYLQQSVEFQLPGTSSGNRAAVKYALEMLAAESTQEHQPETPAVGNEEAAQNDVGIDTAENAAIPQKSDGIRSQLRENQGKLNLMDTVADIRVPHEYAQMSKAEKISWVEKKLQPTGYQVDRNGFGIIDFAMNHIKQAFRYLRQGSAEDAVFEAIPYVLEKGEEISAHNDHKDRGYRTVTIAAPIIVNGQRGNMAVVVKQTVGNHYKVHRILAPDGSVFELSEERNKAEPTGSGGVAKNGALSTTKGSALLGESVMENSSGHRQTSSLVQSLNDSIEDSNENVNTFETESVGAAPQGFDPYSDLQYKYGNQPDRANDFRPVNVPKKDTYGREVSQFVSNAYGAKAVPDSFIPVIEELTVEGYLGHDRRTNAESLKAAAAEIKKDGMYKSRQQITEAIRTGKVGENDIAKAILLFTKYANRKNGDQEAASELFLDLSQLATRAGRDLQLFGLMRKLTPQGQLMAVQKNVQNTLDSINKRRSKKKQVQAEIPQALEQEYMEAAAVTSGDEEAATTYIARKVVDGFSEDAAAAADTALEKSKLDDPEYIRKIAKKAATAAGIRMDNKKPRQDQSVKRQLWDVLIENANNKILAERLVAEKAAELLGLDGEAAEKLGKAVAKAFYDDLAQRSAERCAKLFGAESKKTAVKKTLIQKLENLYNLGAFGYEEYRQAAFDSLFGKGSNIDIPDMLMEDLINAAENEKAEIENAIYKVVASQIPATLGEKAEAWRHMAMLFNLKTQLRNWGGNFVFRPYVQAKRLVGTALETAFLKQEDRTKSFLGYSKNARELLALAKQDAKAQEGRMDYTATTGDNAKNQIEDSRRIFKTKVLEKMRTGLMKTMEGADMLFKRREYATSLASFLKARGYTSGQWQAGKVPDSVLEEGRSYAVREAMKATFNDQNKVSDAVCKLRYKGNNPVLKVFDAIRAGNIPFLRTTANVGVRAMEYNPLAFLKIIAWDINKLRNGEITAANFIDNVSAGLTGSGATVLGYALASGIFGVRLVGRQDDEDEKRMGHQAYAIEFPGGHSLTVDWLAPANIPVFMGANFYEALRGSGKEDVSVFTAFFHACAHTLDPMIELSVLSSLNDAIRSAKYADKGEEIYSFLVASATNYFMQFLPTLFSQMDSAANSSRKTVYPESDDPVIGEFQRLVGRAFQKLPTDPYQTEYVDAWGRTEDQTLYGRAESIVMPFYYSHVNENAVDREIQRLNGVVDENVSPSTPGKTVKINGEDQRLTGKQWTALAKAQGKLQYDIVSVMTRLKTYDSLTDEQKAAAIKTAYTYAKEKARKDTIAGTKGFTAKWMEEIDSSSTRSISSAILDRQLQESSKMSDSQYAEAKAAGFSTEQMADMSALLKGLTPEAGHSGVTLAQKAEAITGSTDLSAKEKEKWLYWLFDDSQDKKLDAAKDLGFSAEDYANAYRLYSDETNTGGKGTKDRIVSGLMDKFDLDRKTAESLYKIYNGSYDN